jgi:hypothetical protein
VDGKVVRNLEPQRRQSEPSQRRAGKRHGKTRGHADPHRPTVPASVLGFAARRTEAALAAEAESITNAKLPSARERIMPAKRTTHRSSKGTKLYAVRDKKGQFKDIQTYKRAHGQDVKRKSKAESKGR